MIGISISEAVSICSGRLIGRIEEDKQLGNIIIDSREIAPGDIFAAFEGELTDGHSYVNTAFKKGAACCLVSRELENAEGPLILVDDVEKAMGQLAARSRSRFEAPVVGITGSVGKTSAKEMIGAVLSEKLRILKTDGNLNNTLGVPMTVSRLNSSHEAGIIELGISHFGEMKKLGEICKPNIAVFTVIGRAHLEFLHDRQGVFDAKTELLDYVHPEGTVIVNGDDDLLSGLRCSQRLIKFGLSEGCDIRAENVKEYSDHTDCEICWEKRIIPVHIPAFGVHMIYAALEGAVVGMLLGLSDDEIRLGIAAYKPVGRRSALVDTGKILLIDDCYNANPDSVMSGIDSMSALPGRKVCILGDMLELGDNEQQLHRKTGEYAAEKGTELVLCCGELSRYTALGAGEAGRYFESKQELMEALPEIIRTGDTVLVKASRRSRFEDISEALKKL